MSIGKKLRFEVFKRDGFACLYCGQTPPEVVLEIDHINPKAEGGTDEINNLLTACFDCNRGKRDIPLDKIPSPLVDNIAVVKEREAQLAEYNRLLESINKRIALEIDRIDEVYSAAFPEYQLSDSFKKTSLKGFLDKLPFTVVLEAMYLACDRIPDSDRAIKYFCGIC